MRQSFLQAHKQTWLEDGTLDWLWSAAERQQIPIALLADGYLQHVERIAQPHPGLKLVVGHFGVRRGNVDEAVFASLPTMLALARLDNVAVKITGGPQEVSDGCPFASLQQRYRAIFDAFGRQRISACCGAQISRLCHVPGANASPRLPSTKRGYRPLICNGSWAVASPHGSTGSIWVGLSASHRSVPGGFHCVLA